LTSGKPSQRQEQYTVAKAYLDGYGVTKSYSKSLLCLRRAADLGHPLAQHLLGDMHRRGLGVALNYGEAKKMVQACN
jgi:TPR repeat protein